MGPPCLVIAMPRHVVNCQPCNLAVESLLTRWRLYSCLRSKVDIDVPCSQVDCKWA